MEEKKAVIGPSIQIKGELIGQEDLAIEGRVEGLIRLTDHELVVGKKARIEATLEAKTIKVLGEVRGDVVAADRVELSEGSSVTGDIISPRIAIADGARFKGTVDMDRSKGAGPGQPKPPASGASAPKPAGGAPAS